LRKAASATPAVEINKAHALVERPEKTKGERGYEIRGVWFSAPPLPPALYVVATPIGNLADVTLRALDTLAAADLVACEDTRITKRLLDRYRIRARVTAYHEHSGPAAHRRILAALVDGRSVALVSDAGTPLLSDPGAKLVVDAHAAGHRVVPIPGPSSAVAALSAAGLSSDSFLFLGFLPSRAGQRKKRLAELARVPATLVLFESPNRIAALLADAADEIGPDRRASICRELTKLYETFDAGSLSELAGRYAGADVKGEIVLLIAPPDAAAPPPQAEVDALLTKALQSSGVKQAAEAVAEMTGLSRRDLYQRALKLKGRG
jgi:16S rRNA (cytidine1402-2'-O)-methyltransferase